jgi:hypothetical protein
MKANGSLYCCACARPAGYDQTTGFHPFNAASDEPLAVGAFGEFSNISTKA